MVLVMIQRRSFVRPKFLLLSNRALDEPYFFLYNTIMKCQSCNKEYSPDCNWKQGRCPHHPSMLEQILDNPYKSRFYNLIQFFKGRK
jgi:hypothetical protein